MDIQTNNITRNILIENILTNIIQNRKIQTRYYWLIYAILFAIVITVTSPVLAEQKSKTNSNQSQDQYINDSEYNDINLESSQRSHFSLAAKFAQFGYSASVNGQWHQARDGWEKAVEHLDQSKASARNRAVFYYEFGHAAGITCDFDIAEEFIEKSYQIEKSINGPYVLTLVELFRLYFDQKQYKLASIYFEAALPNLKASNAAETTPMRYSRLLDEYSNALMQLDKKRLAKQYQRQSITIRKNFNNPQQHDRRTRYGSRCSDTRKNYPMTIAQSTFVSSRMSKIREILKSMHKIQN